MAKKIVNAVGEQCPVPVVRADRAIKEMEIGDILEVRVDNETAVQNLSRLASGKGLRYSVEKMGEALFAVRMAAEEVAPAITGEMEAEREGEVETAGVAITSGGAIKAGDAIAAGQVAVIGSDCMGQGDEELGRILMKGFIYALSQQDKLPETILFYNSGARIPVRGSVSLEDLQGMEELGVEILTCGTCLDYYGLTDSLAAGTVTNMYTIVEKLGHAGKVIKP